MKAILFDANGDDRTDAELKDISSIPDDQLLWVQLGFAEKGELANLFVGKCEPELIDRADPMAVGDGAFALRCGGFYAPGRTTNDVIFIVGRNWFVSVSDQQQPIFEQYIQSDRGKGLKGNLTGTGLLVSLLLMSFEGFQEQLSTIDETIDHLDQSILRSRKRRRILQELADLRAKSATLRRSFVRNRPIIRSITRPDFSELLLDADRPHIAHIAGVYDRVEDQVSAARDEVVGSFDLYATKVTQDTNELLKLLTIVGVITGIVGAIAGTMGMNTFVPMKDAGPNGFYAVLGLMVLSSIIVLVIARMRRWI
jgi:magnesium transporter